MIFYDNSENRSVLMGTVHGGFSEQCDNVLPGIFVKVDDFNVLKFLYEEVYGSGMYV